MMEAELLSVLISRNLRNNKTLLWLIGFKKAEIRHSDQIDSSEKCTVRRS